MFSDFHLKECVNETINLNLISDKNEIRKKQIG